MSSSSCLIIAKLNHSMASFFVQWIVLAHSGSHAWVCASYPSPCQLTVRLGVHKSTKPLVGHASLCTLQHLMYVDLYIYRQPYFLGPNWLLPYFWLKHDFGFAHWLPLQYPIPVHCTPPLLLHFFWIAWKGWMADDVMLISTQLHTTRCLCLVGEISAISIQ